MFRKKILIPIIVVISLGIVFRIFFLEPILSKVISMSMEKVFMAKVDIKDVDISMLKGNLSIKGIDIGNKDDEYKNLVSIATIKSDINTSAILRQSFIINELSSTGIMFDTTRKSSNKLIKKVKKKKKKKPKKESYIAKKIKGSKSVKELKSTFTTDAVSDRFNIDEIIDISSLKTMQTINEASDTIKNLPDAINKELAAIDLSKDIDTIKNNVNSFQNLKLTSPLEIKTAISKIDQTKKLINTSSTKISQTSTRINKQFNNVSKSIAKIEKQKAKDLKNIQNNVLVYVI
jgi:uncharacterized protein (TIGR03545 family)